MNLVNWHEIELFFIAMGAPLAIFISILQILKYRSDFKLSLLALATFFASLVIMKMYLFASGQYNSYYLVMFPGLISSILGAGPASMGQLRKMLQFCLPPARISIWWQLLPVLLALVVELYISIFAREYCARLVNDTFQEKAGTGYIILIASVVHLLLHFVVFLAQLGKMRLQVNIRHGKMLFYLLFIPTSAFFSVILGFSLSIDWLFNLGMLLITLTMFIILAMMVLFPGFFESLEEQVKARYAQTPLSGIDVEEVKEQLAELTETEKIYRDSEIRLSLVANRLGISSNQLSRILNEVYSLGFNDFINSHRVQEAKRAIEAGEKITMLQLAYEVGFNSKSTFNKQFKKFTGLTPKEYESGVSEKIKK